MIVTCTCKNEYQDKRYGSQRRVANLITKKQGTSSACRCTVCTKEISIGKKGDKK
jgi:hypothetical protein